MPDHDLYVMVLRLLLAVGLGALIGIERETHGRPAGLRTHVLVSLGSALFTIISANFGGLHSDPARIAAQVVSGIGFLGAGTIIHQGSVIRGLTTAASLWAVAAIGMGVGAGGRMLPISVVAGVIVYLTLSLLGRIEHSLLAGRRTRDIAVVMSTGQKGVAAVVGALSDIGVDVEGVRYEDDQAGKTMARLRILIPAGRGTSDVNERLTQIPEIVGLDWD